MNDYLKRYKFELETIGPVFIGSGNKILKKEWILDRNNESVVIIDTRKFFDYLDKNNLIKSYEKFIVNDRRGLFAWIKENNIKKLDIVSFTAYNLQYDNLDDINTVKEILTIVKDPYGYPYVPGSSLKGAIRNALMAYRIEKDNLNSKYAKQFNDEINTTKNRMKYMKDVSNSINAECFRTLNYDEKKPKSAVNDQLRGLRISDSKPLLIDDIVLCQKIDIDEEGDCNSLSVLRECLKPKTKIEFTLTLDSYESDIDIMEIEESLNQFIDRYNSNFLNKFETEDPYNGNHIYLGGGVGFPSKTATYQMLNNDKDAYKTVDKIIDNTIGEKQLKHRHKPKRSHVKVSPHVCKLTYYNQDYYQMGICKFNIKPL